MPRHAATIPTLLLLLLVLTGGACTQASEQGNPAGGRVEIEISTVAVGTPVAIGDTFTTPAGETLTVSRLAYYLSNLRLRRVDGGSWSPPTRTNTADGYWLVDLAEPASARIVLDGVPPGDYSGLELMIGVDPARSRDGAQTGALDPVHGMFWTWATGYIHLKLEGRSRQSRERDGLVTLHLGGQDAARSIYPPFATRPLRAEPELRSTAHLHADLAGFLGGAAPLRFADTALAMQAADADPLLARLPALLVLDHLHHAPRVPLAAR
jgi:hypothetical protein